MVSVLKAVKGVSIPADNAYFSVELVERFDALGWNYGISVTGGDSKRPVLRRVEADLEEEDWTPMATTSPLC